MFITNGGANYMQ